MGILLNLQSSEKMKHTEYMEHYFKQKDPVLINVRRKMWSPRGSGWILKGIFATFVNVAQYERFLGVSYFSSCYFSLPKKLQNKKAIIKIQNRDNQCKMGTSCSSFSSLKREKIAEIREFSN